MTRQRTLCICIDARIPSSGSMGGVEQLIIGLASGLSGLPNASEDYVFLAFEDNIDWLAPHIKGASRIHAMPVPRKQKIGKLLGRLEGPTRRAYGRLQAFGGAGRIALPVSDGTVERLCADIMHFTMQSAFRTDIPSIYHPHDLQHVHLPQYFSRSARVLRDRRYRLFCEQARLVAVASTWTKQDIMRQYGIAKEKIAVVPLAPANDCYDVPSKSELDKARRRLALVERFIFYPAQTWPHKNHIGVLKALAKLRDEKGLVVPFVSTGAKNEFYAQIQSCVAELNLESQVRFLGFVTPLELQCLYRLCRATVIPTRFEAASFPVWEAATAGSPVACSNVTSLPAQAGDGALIFDPDDIGAMAMAIERLWCDDRLCHELAANARSRVEQFTWDRTARHFRALYRQIGSRELDYEDHTIMKAPPLL